jgi:SSS family transporter
MIQPWMILITVGLYFLALLFLGWLTGKKADADSYFTGNRQSIWWLVAIGMLSDSMSGVSFISVPGDVYNTRFYYMQLVLGYVAGYAVIAFVLLPVYYENNLTSIYGFLGSRFGKGFEKIGAGYFILSRLLGSAGRLFLTAAVFQTFLFDALGVPFWLSVLLIIVLILTYTIKGGIRTLVFTDAFQSMVLLSGLFLSIVLLMKELSFADIYSKVFNAPIQHWIDYNPLSKTYFWKHFLGGAAVCIAMTGLDQNMMQKNLSCRSLKEAKINMLSTAVMVFLVNVFFVSLGAILIEYLGAKGIDLPMRNGKVYTDGFFPLIAFKYIGVAGGLAFILGLAAATFSSADSVLTTLTTSAYIDFLNADSNSKWNETQKIRLKNALHIGFAVLLLGCILLFRQLNNQALITTIFDIAGITYGPLLGLFGFGIFSKKNISFYGAAMVCVLAPALTWYLKYAIPASGMTYKVGFEALILNGVFTFLGLWVISKKNSL